ncbi:MAG: hypothetical protein KGS61_15430 [Verrucomicrobia bacterium]|nr:hypothetical protein [Verrucomicrobiota bacterium]
MRARLAILRPVGLWLPCLLLTLLASGCHTPKADWNNRVGNLTYDQAVMELGPPDKSAKLTDGTLVAEWLISRGSRYGTIYNLNPFWWGGPMDVSQGPDFYLRLTFGPDGKLRAWKRLAR